VVSNTPSQDFENMITLLNNMGEPVTVTGIGDYAQSIRITYKNIPLSQNYDPLFYRP